MMVVDTDVLVDYLRDHGDRARRVAFELEKGYLATTAITAFELRVGATSKRRRTVVEVLLEALRILPLDGDAAERAADARRDLLARGEDIGVADSLIAGICLANDAMLITRNTKHFMRVPGLKVSGSWKDEGPDE